MTRPPLVQGEPTRAYNIRVTEKMAEALKLSGPRSVREILAEMSNGFWIECMSANLKAEMLKASERTGVSCRVLILRAIMDYLKLECPVHHIGLDETGRCAKCIQEQMQ